MQELQLHNSLTKKKESFSPLGKTVKVYSCGPTVYDYAHIGNFRSFLMSDLLIRVLKHICDYDVYWVMNITDVGHLTNDDMADSDGEDKITKKAKLEAKSPYDIARFFEEAFLEDGKALEMNLPTGKNMPRATEYIPEQITLTQELIDKGYAYKVNGSVYFQTKKFKTYGQLSGNKLEDLIAGARVEVNSEKKDPLDFALWKKADENHLMQWDSPWGKGFPGWHLECSAMSRKLLGDHFDIHTGGEDNKFPHHECEIAQNECSCGHKSVNYWLHGKHLLVEGKKMSKSKGNFYTIRDLLKDGWSGQEIRYTLMNAHYREALNFTKNNLQTARNSIKRINEAYNIFKFHTGEHTEEIHDSLTLEVFTKGYKKALLEDLNVPQALAVTFEIINLGLRQKENNRLREKTAREIQRFLEQDFNNIFQVLQKEEAIPEEIQSLLDQRKTARENKQWEQSDQLRDEIKSLGYEVLDGKEGQRVKKLN